MTPREFFDQPLPSEVALDREVAARKEGKHADDMLLAALTAEELQLVEDAMRGARERTRALLDRWEETA